MGAAILLDEDRYARLEQVIRWRGSSFAPIAREAIDAAFPNDGPGGASRTRRRAAPGSPTGLIHETPRRRAARSVAVGRHAQCEHPIGIDACIERSGVEQVFPLRSIAGNVDPQQGLSELCRRLAVDIEGNGATMDSDRQLLARQVGGADLRSLPDMAKAHRIR